MRKLETKQDTRSVTLAFPKTVQYALVQYTYLDEKGKVQSGIEAIDFTKGENMTQ